jgi:hypothetical protein
MIYAINYLFVLYVHYFTFLHVVYYIVYFEMTVETLMLKTDIKVSSDMEVNSDSPCYTGGTLRDFKGSQL